VTEKLDAHDFGLVNGVSPAYGKPIFAPSRRHGRPIRVAAAVDNSEEGNTSPSTYAKLDRTSESKSSGFAWPASIYSATPQNSNRAVNS
jgi:hypothetical protein